MPKGLSESNEDSSVVAGLARLAKEVIGDARNDADARMAAHQEKLNQRLEQLAVAFDNTDPDAEGTRAMEGPQLVAIVNLIRTLFGKEELTEEQSSTVDKMITTTKGKSRLSLGDKEVSFEGIDFSKIKEAGKRIVAAGKASIAMQEPVKPQPGKPACCWDWIHQVYEAAGVKEGPVLYSEALNKRRAVGRLDYGMLTEGAWLYIYNGNQFGGEHSVLFSRWIDEEHHVAEVMSFPGQGNKNPHQRVHTVDFDDQRITRLSLPK